MHSLLEIVPVVSAVTPDGQLGVSASEDKTLRFGNYLTCYGTGFRDVCVDRQTGRYQNWSEVTDE